MPEKLLFDLATPDDDAELRRLLRETAMPGAISVSMRREPSFFMGAAIEGETHHTVVARLEESGKLVGLGSRSVREAYINGRVARLGYLSQVRIEPGFRRGMRLLQGGFTRLREVHESDDVPLYVTTIIEDNQVARRVLTRGWSRLPTYRERGILTTLVIPLWRRRRIRSSTRFSIHQASTEHLPDIAACLQRNLSAYQFAPHWTADALADPSLSRDLSPADFIIATRGGEVVGCAALWDQRGFKQTVVEGYQGAIRPLRPLINLIAPWTGIPRLPPAGQVLSFAYLSHLAAPPGDIELVLDLVSSAINAARDRKIDYVSLCLAAQHPHLPPLKRAFRHREYRAVLYVAHWDDGAQAVARLDDRIPHLEVATL